jgi:hypothetical protein
MATASGDSRATVSAFNRAFPIDPVFLGRLITSAYRPNVLIECSRPAIEKILRQVTSQSAPPLRCCALPGPVELPGDGIGTLVLQDVAELSRSQQVQLYDWLTERAGMTQVVSLTASSLQSRVAAGEFLEGLYYRLNVMRL